MAFAFGYGSAYGKRCHRRRCNTPDVGWQWRQRRGDISAGTRYWRERERARRQSPTPVPPTFEDVAHQEALLHAFSEYQRRPDKAPGLDGITAQSLSRSEAAAAMRELSRIIVAGQYRPSRSLDVSIPKWNGGTRTIRLRSIPSRVVGLALKNAVGPFCETLFLNGSHGFRPGRGTLTALLEVRRLVREGNHVLAADDVEKAFDNVRIDWVMDDFRFIVSDQRLLDLIERVLRGNEAAERSRGMDQGCGFSPLGLNNYLHHRLDVPFDAGGGPSWLIRYADNILVLCHDASEATRATRYAQDLLQAAGLRLKGMDGPPVDLRRGATLNFLGFALSEQDGRLELDLDEEAWEGLGKGLREAHGHAQPPLRAQEVIQGWLAAAGPAFENRDKSPIVERVLRLGAESGFREIAPRAVARQIQSAADQWQALCAQADQSQV